MTEQETLDCTCGGKASFTQGYEHDGGGGQNICFFKCNKCGYESDHYLDSTANPVNDCAAAWEQDMKHTRRAVQDIRSNS